MTVFLDGRTLALGDLVRVVRDLERVEMSAQSRRRMQRSRDVVEDRLRGAAPIYGVNTGFGKFSEVVIAEGDVAKLQRHLIDSCCVGVGEPFPTEVVRAMLLLRANSLAAGESGVRPEIVEALAGLLNAGVHPIIPSKGSVGASGDLAPLSHMALVLCGRGWADLNGEVLDGAEALRRAGLTPVELRAKEGLSLCNGTQAMTALGALAVHDAQVLADTADVVGAMSAEALRAVVSAFDERLQRSRPHQGQIVCAERLRRMLEGSPTIAAAAAERVQDAYALRCMPQVHGASRDAIEYARGIVETEMNSVTDNPLVYADEGDIVSGGNFHGQPVALAMDFLGIAVAELASVSERRVERLLNPALNVGLPAFLTADGGLNDGLMVAQYTAAALVSENKVLAHPSSVDSIPTSANQEDHVSMGTTAARHAREIVANAQTVLGIELLCAGQAMELRGLVPGRRTAAALSLLRERVEPLGDDRELSGDIAAATGLVAAGELLAAFSL